MINDALKNNASTALLKISIALSSLMGCLHDPANVEQTSSKCIQNTHANALEKHCFLAD